MEEDTFVEILKGFCLEKRRLPTEAWLSVDDYFSYGRWAGSLSVVNEGSGYLLPDGSLLKILVDYDLEVGRVSLK